MTYPDLLPLSDSLLTSNATPPGAEGVSSELERGSEPISTTRSVAAVALATVYDIEEEKLARMLRVEADQVASALDEVLRLYRRDEFSPEMFLEIVRSH